MEFEIGEIEREVRIGRDRSAQHLQALVHRGDRRDAIVRAARRYEDHALETQLHSRRFGDEEMRVVDGIEGSAEDPELHAALERCV